MTSPWRKLALHTADLDDDGHDTTGGTGLAYQAVRRTAGSITLALSTTTMTEVSSALRLTIAAVAGDVLHIALSTMCTNGSSGETVVDSATIVSGAIVNQCGGGTRAPSHGYIGIASGTIGFNGTIRYVVQAGDISGGNVVVSPTFIRSTAQNGTMFATTVYALNYSVVNLGQ